MFQHWGPRTIQLIVHDPESDANYENRPIVASLTITVTPVEQE